MFYTSVCRLRIIFKSHFVPDINNFIRNMSTGNRKKKSAIPDRWEDYEPIGEPLSGCRFITFKVPLKSSLCNRVEEHMRFSPETLVEHCGEKGWKLGLVIDLTNTKRYYDPMSFAENDIEYQKIFTEGHVVPSKDVRKRFTAIVDDFTERKPDPEVLIGVHCTHGVNRTGYLVCRYLVDRLGKDADEALTTYKEARGYAVERENYLNDLRTGPKITDEEYKQFRLEFCESQQTTVSKNEYSRNFKHDRNRQNLHNDSSRNHSASDESRGRSRGGSHNQWNNRMPNGFSEEKRQRDKVEAESYQQRTDYNENNNSRGYGKSRGNSYRRENYQGRRGGYHNPQEYSNPRRNFSTDQRESFPNGYMEHKRANNFNDSYNSYGGQNNRYRGAYNHRGDFHRDNQHPYRRNTHHSGYGGNSYGYNQSSETDDYGSFGYRNHQR